MTIDVSIVVPVYNEEESVPHLVRKVYDVMSKTTYAWELICIDDGSKDKSASILNDLTADYPQLKPLFFRRNYGQTAAMQAGFDHAQGTVIVTMDADLQNDPVDIPRILKKMEETDADIVSGWRYHRQDNTVRVIPSKIANWMVAKMTGINLHDTGCSLKAYKKEAIADVKIYGELHRFIPAIVSQNGARVEEMVVNHHARQYGSSKYGLDRMFRVILDLILIKFFLTYLNRPSHAFGLTGMFCLFVGMLMLAYLVLVKLFMGEDIGTRPLLIISVMLIILGVQLIGMGLLGELIMRVYHEPQGRKQYILRTLKPVTKAKAKAKSSAKSPAKKPVAAKAKPKTAAKKK